MKRDIGYYVHHQGAGHRDRAVRIAHTLERRCTLIGTFGGEAGLPSDLNVLDLPDDRVLLDFDGRDGARTRPLCLHYAPLGHPGIRTRMAAIADWIDKTDPALLIVDVSVEVALLARLLSLPTLVFRLAGMRTDPAHLEAFRAAERLIAPFPEAFEANGMPDWVREKTLYAGLLAGPGPVNSSAVSEDGRITILFGRGGEGGCLERLAATARAVPKRDWHVLGPVRSDSRQTALPRNLHLHGWVENVRAHLAPASLVVGGCGDGVLAAVASAGKRFVCLPEPRAYGEQTAKAVALTRLGAAVMHEGWPDERSWPALIAKGLSLDPANISALVRQDSLEHLAGEIERIAGTIEAGLPGDDPVM